MARRYFILAPREMSLGRVKQLLKELLPRRPVTLGVAEEEYVEGFTGQSQFKTLKADAVKGLAAQSSGRLTLLPYQQKDVVKVIEQLDFDRAIVVNGSHHRSFHLRPEYQAIREKGATIKFVSPFTDETEAKQYAATWMLDSLPSTPSTGEELDHAALRQLLQVTQARSFATDFQTAAAVVVSGKIQALCCNQVLPYPTYAWQHGSTREKRLTPAGDSSYYDTVHAETAALLEAGAAARGGALYCITFPCPHCTRNIIAAGIKKVYYQLDYGDDYGYNLFKEAGIEYEKF